MEEFKYVGRHADELEDGRPLAPGDYTGPIKVGRKKNKQLVDDALLLPVPDGTAEAVQKANEAAAAAKNGDDDGDDPETTTDNPPPASRTSVTVGKRKEGDT